ncbi:MAG: glycosyltransferase [Actinomycetota bacterium]|nr:glycosyltransferase [Actinomycetota bacterium]
MTAEVPSPLRSVLLYAHDTYGLGHLRRNLAIAAHLLDGCPGLRVVLMSGSPVAERFAIPRGLSLVRLPPVVKVGVEAYRARDGRLGLSLVRRLRSAIMVDVARRFRPDVFLVDHAPRGMKGELLPVFEELRTTSASTRIVLGLRDIVDDPGAVRSSWSDQGVYETLESVFDRILVYGSRELLDVADAYGLGPALRGKLCYCGYLAKGPLAAPRARSADPRLVLGTAGGGGDGVEVLSATLAACKSLGLASTVVTGPLMAGRDRRVLDAQASTDPRASVSEFVADMGAEMARAGAVVTMGGYNSLAEIVSIGVPAIVVPRLQPRREQLIRARVFARRGLVSVVEPGPLLAERLAAALTGVLATAREPARRPRAGVDVDGLSRVREALEAEGRAARLARGQAPSFEGRAGRESRAEVVA